METALSVILLALVIILLPSVILLVWRLRQTAADLLGMSKHQEVLLGQISADVNRQIESQSQIAQRLSDLAACQEVMARHGGGLRGYEQAIRMAQGNVSAAQIAASCGVTTHEAELLVRLHGNKSG